LLLGAVPAVPGRHRVAGDPAARPPAAPAAAVDALAGPRGNAARAVGAGVHADVGRPQRDDEPHLLVVVGNHIASPFHLDFVIERYVLHGSI
jgi:hypothetical protein